MNAWEPQGWISTVLAIWVSLSLVFSLVLFSLQVFGRHQTLPGQIPGLVYSAISTLLFLYTFADRLPTLSGAIALRGGHLFTSSMVALATMTAVYVLRAGVYLKLFALPAVRLSEADYYSVERIEERANDATAPLLAFMNLAVVSAAAIGGVAGLPAWVGVALFVGIFALYSFATYLRNLQIAALWLVVHLQILWRRIRTVAERAITFVIVAAAKFEIWRRRGSPELEEFVRRMENKLRESDERAAQEDASDRERIRRVVDNDGKSHKQTR